jgi:hypothetical protein
MKKRGHWGMALRAHEADRDRIGEMNAAWWEHREALGRRLGIETRPDRWRPPGPKPAPRSVGALLLD